MANAADGGLVLELYRLRQEETLRAARRFMAVEFWPKDLEELRAVSRAMGTDKNAYWRQVISYWEMASSLALRGAVDADLFLDSNAEGIFLYAKFHHWHAETEKESGNPFMERTARLIAQFPAAKAMYEVRMQSFAATRK